jgi:hypothetical protein
VIEVQPPYLDRCPWDEIWVKTDGNCKIAIWYEWQEIDFLCDTARGNFKPRDADRGQKPGLPNPIGQGNNGNPSLGTDDTIAPDATGNGRGDDDPFDPPGTQYQLWVAESGQNSQCVRFQAAPRPIGGLFPVRPTYSFPKDGNRGDGSVACGYNDERHVRIILNGNDFGGANAFGLAMNPVIRKFRPDGSPL